MQPQSLEIVATEPMFCSRLTPRHHRAHGIVDRRGRWPSAELIEPSAVALLAAVLKTAVTNLC
jgi:hypothetical protein